MPRSLSPQQIKTLLATLKTRFENNMHRHAGVDRKKVEATVNGKGAKLRSLAEMEKTGGEPDVVVLDKKSKEIVFVDCAPQSPAGRRSLCYDHPALTARKANKPKDSALHMAQAMGVALLDEEQYRNLQAYGPFDTTTSSRILTPPAIRQEGGALFCDYRYKHVFTYHNGADSYYAARGWRGMVTI